MGTDKYELTFPVGEAHQYTHDVAPCLIPHLPPSVGPTPWARSRTCGDRRTFANSGQGKPLTDWIVEWALDDTPVPQSHYGVDVAARGQLDRRGSVQES